MPVTPAAHMEASVSETDRQTPPADDEQERWSRLLLPTQGRLATSAGMDDEDER
jgi:hypothetical protein